MRITVLGKSPAWPDADGACSGYLIQHEQTNLLLDCGPGVLAKLRTHIDYTAIDAVLISHIHGDHVLDLVPFSYALAHSPRQQARPIDSWPGTDKPVRPKLWLPPEGEERLSRISSAWDDPDLIGNAFEIEDYDADTELEIGGMNLRFCEVPHFILTHAVEISTGSGEDRARFTFGADCRSSSELVEFAADTDLLFLEATLDQPESGPRRGHMSAGEAGALAAAAGAHHTVLTHLTDELDPERTLADAKSAHPDGSIELAQAGAVYELGPNSVH